MNERSARPVMGARPVVVGVDGSPASLRAVDAAAWEAERRRVPLLLAFGYMAYVPISAPGWVPSGSVFELAEQDALAVLDEAKRRVAAAYPGLTVHTRAINGPGASVLVTLSRDASLVVTGSRGRGGFAGLTLGSVAAQVAAHAHAPVLVVRPGGDERGPVVVGVDGSPEAMAATEFAFDEASARGVPLVALYVWWSLPRKNLGPVTPTRYDAEEAQAEADRMLAEAIAGWKEKYPDVPVERRAVADMNPPAALVDASSGASLVVVGSRGRGGFASLLLGSVSRALVCHAKAPVAVVHKPKQARQEE